MKRNHAIFRWFTITEPPYISYPSYKCSQEECYNLQTDTTSMPMFSPSLSQSVQMINSLAPLTFKYSILRQAIMLKAKANDKTSFCNVFLIKALLFPSPRPFAIGASNSAMGLHEYLNHRVRFEKCRKLTISYTVAQTPYWGGDQTGKSSPCPPADPEWSPVPISSLKAQH